MKKKIYDLVCRRFIAAFLPAAIFNSCKIMLDIAGESFKSTGKSYSNLGWRKAENAEKKEIILPDLKENEKISIQVKL